MTTLDVVAVGVPLAMLLSTYAVLIAIDPNGFRLVTVEEIRRRIRLAALAEQD